MFWVFILLLLGCFLFLWREELRVRHGTHRMLDEIEAYLTKRLGGK